MSGPKENLYTTKAESKSCQGFFLLVLFSVIAFWPWEIVQAEPGLAPTGRAYVIYDVPMRYGDNMPLVDGLMEYLGHFYRDCEAVQVEDWQADEMAAADAVVVVGLEQTRLPDELLDALVQAKQVIWFERNIEQLAGRLGWSDFRMEGASAGWDYMQRTEVNEPALLLPNWMDVVIADPGAEAQVIAEVKTGKQKKPLAWRRGNVCYSGLLEMNPFFMTMLGNLLHVFIPNDHVHSQQALIRIEDVSPLTDPKAVRKVVDVVIANNLPFAIGVISVGIDPDGNQTYLHEVPALVEVLQYAQSHGASIILHGYTHQNEFSPKTGEGYEFWNARDDRPLEDAYDFTCRRLEAGIAELMRCNLVPVAMEPPHYAMSREAYRATAKYFNIFSGQVQMSDESEDISMSLPYIARSSYLYGMTIIPENMGYYDGKEFLVSNMLRVSAQVAQGKDAFAGFFYHGYLPPDKLPAILDGLRRQGYLFLDLRQLEIHVKSPQIRIDGNQGEFQIWVDPELEASWQQGTVTPKHSLIERATTVHITILVAVLVVLIGIIVRLRFTANQKYEAGLPTIPRKPDAGRKP